MPACLFSPRATAAFAFALALFALGTAGASDHGAAAEPKGATAEPANEPAQKKLKPVIDATRDPLDVLRERLAQKLGATRAPDAASPNVVRVISKTSTPLAAERAPELEMPRPKPRRAAALVASPLASPLAAAALPQAGQWDYTGIAGPDSWGRLNPESAKCSSGTRQSPIDIREGIRVELDPVRFDYQPSAFRVIDNGHTVQVNVAAGNSIEVMGRRYELMQFHFHRPSEERIEGKQFDMVVHLEHKDAEGRIAVVAVLLERGSAQPVVQSVWNNLPLEKGEEVAARSVLDLNELLPPERRYFTYMGSLTTPPCSEGVLWMVMKQPVPISAEQIGIFTRLYPMNARPVQSAGGRLIKESN